VLTKSLAPTFTPKKNCCLKILQYLIAETNLHMGFSFATTIPSGENANHGKRVQIISRKVQLQVQRHPQFTTFSAHVISVSCGGEDKALVYKHKLVFVQHEPPLIPHNIIWPAFKTASPSFRGLSRPFMYFFYNRQKNATFMHHYQVAEYVIF
jgi:hypothetical protein